MATFEKRGDLQWRAKIRRSGYPAQSKTFDTKAEAQRWARDIEREMDQGVFVDRSEAERNTLADVLERYLNEITPLKKGAAPEACRMNAMRERAICDLKMAGLTSKAFAEYRDERLQQVAPATVTKELNLFSHAIDTARKEWGIHLPDNPVRLVRRPKGSRARERRLEGREEQGLLNACKTARNPFLAPVVQLAIETAMRQSEIVNLEWVNINLEKRVARLIETKNGESRSVPLSSVALDILNSLDTQQSNRVFPGLTAEAVKRSYMRACKRANISDLRFHDLRHEATSRLVEKGFNPLEVSAITGHKTLQMLKRYTHLNATNLAARLD